MYHNILVPIDGSPTANQGLCEAIKLAKDQRGKLRLLHVANERYVDCGFETGTYGGALVEYARVDGHKLLSEAQALAQRSGLHAEALLVESSGGPIAEFILAQAMAWPADLIVMGTHGRRGLGRVAMGSDAESVVRGTPVPVLLVRATASPVAATEAASVNSSGT